MSHAPQYGRHDYEFRRARQAEFDAIADWRCNDCQQPLKAGEAIYCEPCKPWNVGHDAR